jgi:Fe-S cluster biogenesis protein NfuA
MNGAMEKKVNKILGKVRPYIQMHGGDVILVEAKKGTVTLKIYGACVGCALADLTYNKMLGTLIKEEIPEIKKVEII